MKQLLIALFLTAATGSLAQKAKVGWKFSSKKITEGKYELHMTASVPTGWHLYSQFTGEGPVATSFKFNKNALVSFEGKIKEIGKMTSVNDPIWKNKQKFFSGEVDFVQTLKIKSRIKTNVSGEVEFMICDDRNCLPPITQKFNITL